MSYTITITQNDSHHAIYRQIVEEVDVETVVLAVNGWAPTAEPEPEELWLGELMDEVVAEELEL